MRATVDEVISGVIRKEGGYVHHPDDRGGPTKFGIALKTLSEWRGSPVTELEVKDLTEDEARQIYRRNYYQRPGFVLVAVVSAAIAAELTDCGVVMGPEVPSRFLQRALNGLNLKGKIFPDLVVDGRVGAVTVEALRRFIMYRGARGERVILKLLESLQAVRFLEITERREANESFLYGWIDKRIGE